MEPDDLEPQRQPKKQKDLSNMSLEALGEYIQELEHEIDRAKAVIQEKENARQGAETFFKS